jgi:uncharacterized LabA/DUF88 family protein
MPGKSPTVAVFIDWQNTYKTAREAFGWTTHPGEYGNYSPYNLARILAAGNKRGLDAVLVVVEVHRGLPSQRHEKTGYAANRRQSAAWMKEAPGLVIPRTRPLRWDHDTQVAREKGIDVQLAVSAVEWTLTSRCDVAIIFSHDTDLLPAVELIARLKGPDHVETAAWISDEFQSRLRTRRGVPHHAISHSVFSRVEQRINYAHPQT